MDHRSGDPGLSRAGLSRRPLADFLNHGRVVGSGEDVDAAIRLNRQGHWGRLAYPERGHMDYPGGCDTGGYTLTGSQAVKGPSHRLSPGSGEGG